MGILSNRVDRSEIKGGDHIYTWRAAFTYSHHGIYVGENKVVHFTAQENTGSGSGSRSSSGSGFGRNFFSAFPSSQSSHSATCSSILGCGSHQPGSGVILSCFNCFIGNGSAYLFQYEASKFAYITEVRGGTCTTAKSDPPEEVIHRATYLFQNGFGSYDVIRNNCEDFALYCKTGLLIRGTPITGTSGQVNFLLNEPWKVIIPSIIQKVVGGPMGAFAAVASAQAHGLNRYKTDIGVRDDVEKVNVEDVALFRGKSVIMQSIVCWSLTPTDFVFTFGTD